MLPFYGDVGLLQATVGSVIAQEDPNWRLTVVDDHYPDPTVATWFADLGDNRVRYLRNETNLGINRNFQRCVDLVEADRAVLLGCDDLLLPNYVAVIRRLHAAHPDAGIIQPGVEVIDSQGRPTRTLVDEAKRRLYAPRFSGTLELGGEDLAVSLLRGNWLYFPSLAWRSKALQGTGFRDGLATIQDLALVIDLLQAGETMVVDDEVCFQYRRHLASVSSSRAVAGSRFQEERTYFAEVADRLRDQGWNRAAQTARLHLSSRLHALTLLPRAIGTGNRDGVRTLGRHAFGSGRESVPAGQG